MSVADYIVVSILIVIVLWALVNAPADSGSAEAAHCARMKGDAVSSIRAAMYYPRK
jgi:hypothetical protein